MRKSKAFTLAEVLITLVIIGVIAAMTIPTLMGNTNNQEFKAKFKKALSSLNQAASLEYALYGNECCKGYDCGSDHVRFAEMLKNHLSVIDACMGGDCSKFKTADGLIYDVYDNCSVNVDLNGDKGNGEWQVDVYGIVMSPDNKHTLMAFPAEWDNGMATELLN